MSSIGGLVEKDESPIAIPAAATTAAATTMAMSFLKHSTRSLPCIYLYKPEIHPQQALLAGLLLLLLVAAVIGVVSILGRMKLFK